MGKFKMDVIDDLYLPVLIKLVDLNYDYVDLYSLELLRGDDGVANRNIIKGELYPLAIQVVPVADEFSDFEIIEDECRVVVRNSRGNLVSVNGQISVDASNNTVMFSWDTTTYSVDQYTIVFWITLKYNGVKYKIMSDTINRSLRQESILE